MMKKQNGSPGFTFIEITIAVGVIAVILAIGTLCFSRARLSAQEAKAQGELSSYNKAITEFLGTNGRYPATLGELNAYITIQNVEEKYELNPDLPQ